MTWYWFLSILQRFYHFVYYISSRFMTSQENSTELFLCFLSKGGTVSPSYSETLLVLKKGTYSINEKVKLSPLKSYFEVNFYQWNFVKFFVKFISWEIYVIIFKMIHSPYPGVASRYVKRIIEICGCVKDEKSAIIHCAMQQFSIFLAIFWSNAMFFHHFGRPLKHAMYIYHFGDVLKQCNAFLSLWQCFETVWSVCLFVLFGV